jgi:hypothetical protein
MNDLFCGQCGNPFKGGRPDRKWCSNYCAQRAGRIRRSEHKGTTEEGRDCPRCGTHFSIEQPNSNQRYCSNKCSVEAARELRKVWARREYKIRRPLYEAKRQFKDVAINRLRRRYPTMPEACKSCGENRILEITHRPEFKRNGAWRLASNTQGHMVWILCPTCHKLLDRGICTQQELGLK